MRNIFACAVALTLASGAASAQDAAWTGFYGGLSMATQDGSQSYNGGAGLYDLEGPAFGAFAGYLWSSGNLVYGAELAASWGGVYEVNLAGTPSFKDEYEYTRFADLKGRLGYDLDGILLYATAGLSRTSYISGNMVTTDSTGTVFGLGADYRLGGRYFIGAEYLRRNYEFFDSRQEVDIEGDIDSFSLRAGVRF